MMKPRHFVPQPILKDDIRSLTTSCISISKRSAGIVEAEMIKGSISSSLYGRVCHMKITDAGFELINEKH